MRSLGMHTKIGGVVSARHFHAVCAECVTLWGSTQQLNMPLSFIHRLRCLSDRQGYGIYHGTGRPGEQ